MAKVKYNPETLCYYTLEQNNSVNFNVFTIFKHNVRRYGANFLSHYYIKINLSNETFFEFHPGSQPNTFQEYNQDINNAKLISEEYLCDNCARKKLHDYIEKENTFNIVSNNCERISLNRTSAQTLIITGLVVSSVLFLITKDSIWFIITLFLIALLIYYNTYYTYNDVLKFCEHVFYDS